MVTEKQKGNMMDLGSLLITFLLALFVIEWFQNSELTEHLFGFLTTNTIAGLVVIAVWFVFILKLRSKRKGRNY